MSYRSSIIFYFLFALKLIGVDAVKRLDEFAENLLEELDNTLEATNIQGATVVNVLLMCCYCVANICTQIHTYTNIHK